MIVMGFRAYIKVITEARGCRVFNFFALDPLTIKDYLLWKCECKPRAIHLWHAPAGIVAARGHR